MKNIDIGQKPHSCFGQFNRNARYCNEKLCHQADACLKVKEDKEAKVEDCHPGCNEPMSECKECGMVASSWHDK